MNTLIERIISYDFVNHSWHLNTNAGRKSHTKTMHWGAKQVPAVIHVGGNSHLSHRRIQFRSFIQVGGQRLVVGPLIGILTSQGKRYPFSGVRSNFIDIIKTGRRKGAIVFVFTPEGVNWHTEQVKGFLYHPGQNSWKKAIFPLPNVVYNRIPNRDDELTPGAQKCISRLQNSQGISLFNPHFFNKQKLFKILERSPILSKHLPQTQSLHSKKNVQDMLGKFSNIYLKPTKGKAGSGIMKVSLDVMKKRYILTTHKSHHSKSFYSFSTLWAAIRQHLIPSPYIIQQGISLSQLEKCPFDFRALIQKGEQGTWQIAGLGIRVAGINRITTHVPRGGRIESPDAVLTRILPEAKAQEIENEVRQLAIDIAHDLDRYYGNLGEMSMDIGLDTKGKLWFFEANSKPMKFDEPDIRKKSLENIIGYSQFLTFNKQRGGSRLDAVAHSY